MLEKKSGTKTCSLRGPTWASKASLKDEELLRVVDESRNCKIQPAIYAPNSILDPVKLLIVTSPLRSTIIASKKYLRLIINFVRRIILRYIGSKSHLPTTSAPPTMPAEATSGCKIVHARRFPCIWFSGAITWETTDAIINPTMSSRIAADRRTIPILVFRRSGELLNDERIANVVPREVEHNAAPAVKPCKGVAPNAKTKQMSDRPIGAKIPTRATLIDKTIFAFNRTNLVDNPPARTVSITDTNSTCSICCTHLER